MNEKQLRKKLLQEPKEKLVAMQDSRDRLMEVLPAVRGAAAGGAGARHGLCGRCWIHDNESWGGAAAGFARMVWCLWLPVDDIAVDSLNCKGATAVWAGMGATTVACLLQT